MSSRVTIDKTHPELAGTAAAQRRDQIWKEAGGKGLAAGLELDVRFHSHRRYCSELHEIQRRFAAPGGLNAASIGTPENLGNQASLDHHTPGWGATWRSSFSQLCLR